MLLQFIDELRLLPRQDKQAFIPAFSAWLSAESEKARQAGHSLIALKHPLLALMIDQIEAVIRPRYVVITRPLANIEQTRLRRQWAPVYGQAGARAIYQLLYNHLHQIQRGYLCIAYDEFRRDPAARRQLLDHLGLSPTAEQLARAEAWVR